MIIHFTRAAPWRTVRTREERLMSRQHQVPELATSVVRHAGLSVRLAVPADAFAICTIYNQGIEDRIATLETELRTAEERHQWLLSRGPRHPVIVAEAAEAERQARAGASPGARGMGTERSERQARAGASPGARAMVGWASLNSFNPRRAYDGVADLSVYVERGWRGRGVDRKRTRLD